MPTIRSFPPLGANALGLSIDAQAQAGWSQPSASGTVDFTITRSNLEVAPDAVFFEAVASGLGEGNPNDYVAYDPRKQEVD